MTHKKSYLLISGQKILTKLTLFVKKKKVVVISGVTCLKASKTSPISINHRHGPVNITRSSFWVHSP